MVTQNKYANIFESFTYHSFWSKCTFHQIPNSNGTNKGRLGESRHRVIKAVSVYIKDLIILA